MATDITTLTFAANELKIQNPTSNTGVANKQYVDELPSTLNLQRNTSVLGATVTKTNNDSSQDTWQTTTLTMTLPSAGVYEVYYNVCADIDPPSGGAANDLTLMCRLYNVTDSAAISGVQGNIVGVQPTSSATQVIFSGFCKGYITVTLATTIRLEFLYHSNEANVVYNLRAQNDTSGYSPTLIGYAQQIA